MKIRAALLLCTLAACASGPPEDFCAASDMNRMVWKPSFAQEVEGYFGENRADLYWDDGRIAEQVVEGLGGPPNPVEKLGGGLVMGSACRAHSCPERAAVIVRCPAEVVAFGVKYFKCSGSPETRCDSIPTFAIYSRTDFPHVARTALDEWVRREAREEGFAPVVEYRHASSGGP